MANLTAPVRGMIKDELRRSGSVPSAIARRYSVPISTVREIREEAGLSVARTRSLTEECHEEVPDRLKPYLVYIKPIYDDWPETAEIQQAKQDYDDGIVEICQGRLRRSGKRDALALYRIPRKKRDDNRRPYFSHVYEG